MSSQKRFIPVAQPSFLGKERDYVLDCLDSGWISSNGKYITRFEQAFAEFCGSKHGISCCNGTVSLHLALLAYGIGAGDEVILPTLTYIASANAIKYVGATPVFVDSEESTWNMDPRQIEAKITPKTRAIMVVHLYGHPTDMDPIMEIATRHNLIVIEDAAEAHGALYKGKKVGSIGHIGSFSFFGNKTITTGEGGMLVTDDKAIADKIRLLKGQGMDPSRRYWFNVVGYNYRMTNIEAAIGLAQLETIETHLMRRREIAKKYTEALGSSENFITIPVEADWAKHSFWMFSILLKENVKIGRDRVMELLHEEGIETRPLFYPMHVMPPYFEKDGHYPLAEKIAASGMNLPTHVSLNDDDIVYIADKIQKIVSAGTK